MLANERNSTKLRAYALLAAAFALCADWCKYVPTGVWNEVAQCVDCAA
jgi:hypothetical protein